MGDKAAAPSASPGSGIKASRTRGGDWNKNAKDAPTSKRGSRAKQQVSESEEEEEEEEEDEEEADGDDGDEEEADGDDGDEAEDDDAADDDDPSETGSDSDREPEKPRKKLVAARKPSPRPAAKAAAAKATKTKDDDKHKPIKSEKPPPSGSAGRRRTSDKPPPVSAPAPPPAVVAADASKAYASDEDSSETTSQGATDDEMIGRGAAGAAGKTTAKAGATSVAPNATAAKEAAGKDLRERSDRERSDRDREQDAGRGRERERGGDRYRERPLDRDNDRDRERDRERDLERERNSSMTLPSLSRAAMMHMNRGRDGSESGRSARTDPRDDVPMNGYGAEPSGRSAGWRRDRSRSRSRERPQEPRDTSNRWNESNQPKDNGRDEDMSSYSGDGGRDGGHGGGGGGRRDDEPMSPGQDGQDVRIMFHGREIYADDLIGLRVAKTFVGHGRFLGQVVKFDEPTSLYTIVYADGDAEELSIENTIQILIQDEIERADPSVPPVSSAFRNDRIPDSPEAGSVTPASSTATVSVPVAPMNAAAVAAATAAAPPPPQTQAPPVFQSRRSTVAFTDREAQFVMGMFENNALPVLLRQGWRVQSNAAGTEQRFLAPPGNFRGANHVFLSAFDVVELIVLDNELLSVCFPQNMHSVILSLFPETTTTTAPSRERDAASRKRGSPAVPVDAPVDSYDSKRVRGVGGIGGGGGSRGDSGYAGAPVGVAPMGRPSGPSGSMGGPTNRSDDRLVPPVSYRTDGDRDHRDPRDGYGAPPPRMAPPGPNDRFAPNGPSRGEPSDGYRRTSSGGGSSGSGDYRTMPLRPMASEGPPPGSTSSRWGAGLPPGGVPQDAAEYHHRRGYGDTAPEWHDRDPMAGRNGGPPPSSSSGGGYMSGGRPSSGGNHRSDEPNRAGGVYYSGDRGMARGSNPSMGRGGGPSISNSGEPMSSYGRYHHDSRGPPPPVSSSSGGQYSPGPDAFSNSNRYVPNRSNDGPVPDYRGASPGGPPQQQGDRFARPLSRGGSGSGSLNGGPGPGPGSAGPGPGGRGFSMMDVERNVSGSGPSGGGGGGYDHRMERGRSPHLGGDLGGGPGAGGSYGGPPSHAPHYGHHQRASANGGPPNPADDSRTI